MVWIFALLFCAVLGDIEERKCTDCSCSRWDGSNYSNCRLVTDSSPCNGYCVKCQGDGYTPMPGFWTKMKEKCEEYEQATTTEEPETSSTETSSTEEETTVAPCPENECCNLKGDRYCEGFKDYCEGEENANVREGCAKTCKVGNCAFEEIISGTCEDVGMDSIESDDDCKRALVAMGVSESWSKETSSSSMYNGCFTASSGSSYFVYDKRSSKYAMSDPKSPVKAGTKKRKNASDGFTYYCHKEEEEVGDVDCGGLLDQMDSYTCNADSTCSNQVVAKMCKKSCCEQQNIVLVEGLKNTNSAWYHPGSYVKCYSGECYGAGNSYTACKNAGCIPRDNSAEEEGEIAMQTLQNTPLVVNGFAALGLCVTLYGAFRHFTQK